MSWKDNIIKTGNLTTDEHGILRCVIAQSDAYEFHKKHTKGAHLRKLKNVKYHQIQWETPYYEKILDEYLNNINLHDKLILDFGCGDGRFTEYLLSKGANKIICVDFDYNTLESLAIFAKENSCYDKLLIIHSDFNSLPEFTAKFDLILSIGVLYYLNENYEKAVSYFFEQLKPNSYFITSDPDMESFLFRTLIFDGLHEAIELFNQRRFKETKDTTAYKFRVFSENEWLNIFNSAGFEIINQKGISFFHNIVRVLLLRGIIKEDELDNNIQTLWKIFDYLHDNGTLHKHKIWLLKKT
jgi:SAM-dependent methyltransferase